MKHFGTDGIRCKENIFTEEYLTKIASGLVFIGAKRVIFGRDPRTSGPRMEKTMSKVLVEHGVEVLSAGMVPTPVLAYLTKFYRCDYGIMLSASHNPPEYNGVKLFSANGSKVAERVELAVEDYIDNGGILPENDKKEIRSVDGAEEYINYILSSVNVDLSGLRIALDTANGATSLIAPQIFRKAGAEVFPFNTETDGIRINENCGATVPSALVKVMSENGFDLGFTYDGDGDRVMCVKNGKVFNGDHLMYAHCKEMKKSGTLVKNTMVGTVMSNLGTEKACERSGINLVRTGVGDKCVFREMEKCGYNVGGEESGHIIFTDYMPTGDGILASVLTAKLDKAVGIDILDDITEYPSVSDCIVCGKAEVARFNESEELKAYLANIDKEYRTVVRPSGTEPKIRILVEAESLERAREKCAEIKKRIEEKIYESIQV